MRRRHAGAPRPIQNLWTTSQIGVNWVEHREGNADYYQLDGLVPLAAAS